MAETMVHFLPFMVAFGVSLLLAPLVRAGARRYGYVARPSGERWHSRPTALLGGVGIFGGLLAGLIVLGTQVSPLGGQRVPIGIVAAGTLMFFTGLIDDAVKLRPASKLVMQTAAAAALLSSGVVYPITSLYSLDVLFTFFWFIGVTNAVNLLDNMDGVAAGVTTIAASFLAFSFFADSRPLLGGVCLALAGATAGFLPFNLNRASIFMGDAGSLLLGSMLAGLGAAYPGRASGSLLSVLFVPAFIAIIPIVDTTLVTVMRTLAGRPVSVGGRDHTSHRLVAMGLTERQVAFLLYSFAAVGGLVALVLQSLPLAAGLGIGSVFLVALAILAAYLGQLHSYGEGTEPPGRVTILVSGLLYKRRALEVLMDLVLFTVAYYAAFMLRFDGAMPASYGQAFASTLPIAVAVMSVCFAAIGVYRGVWQQISLPDLSRFGRAVALGAVATAFAVLFGRALVPVPLSVIVIFALLVGVLTVVARVSFRLLDALRAALTSSDALPVVIYGAGKGGAAVCRELLANPALGLRAVGFVDDDAAKRGLLIHGLPVLGGGGDLSAILEQTGARKLILSTDKLPQDGVRSLMDFCSGRQIPVVRLQFELLPLAATNAYAAAKVSKS